MRTSSKIISSLFAVLVTSTIACGGGGGAAVDANSANAAAKPAGDPTMPKAPDHPDSDKVTWTHSGKSCHTKDQGAGDLVASVTTIAKGCVDTSKMKMLGQATQGKGSETGQMVTPIPLNAKANHCYRVFGLAQASVTDFDIAVMDSAGKSTGEDLTDSNDAIVLEDGNICFKVDDTVAVNAAVASGAGNWAIEVWSDE
jgi:hypothetical protein